MKMSKTRGVRTVGLLGACLGACTPRGTAGDEERTAAERAAVESPVPAPFGLAVGPEFALGQPVPNRFVPQTHQAAASNAAGTTLVVWSVNVSHAADIYGARIAADGTLLDPAGIPIGAAPFEQVMPAVASDGVGWFVAWEDQHQGGPRKIRGTRVAGDGTVLEPAGIAISSRADRDEVGPSVAHDGTTFLVGWGVGNATTVPPGVPANSIVAARVDATGTVLDPSGVLVGSSLPVGTPSLPSVAFDGTHWIVASSSLRSATNSHDVVGSRLTTSLSFAGSFLVDAAGDQTAPAVDCVTAGCFVVWQAPTGIFGSRLNAGVLGDPSGIPIATGGTTPRALPAVAADGSGWLAAWSIGPPFSTGSIQVARISGAGSVLDSNPVGLGSGTSVGVTKTASRAIVAWGDGLTGNTRAQYFPLSDPPSAAMLVSSAPRHGREAAAAASNGGHLVVWVDDGSASTTIRGTRVTPSGGILDPNGIQISRPHDAQNSPAVASDGTDWLVVWADYRNGTDYDIYGTRVLADGTVPDSEATLIRGAAQNQTSPQVAFNDSNWLVTWGSDVPGAPGPYAARVSPAGSVLDPNGIDAQGGVIAGGGDAWLSVQSVFDGTNLDLYGQRIANDGTVLDAQPFVVSESDTVQHARPAVSYGAGRWFVVWENNGARTVSARRVDASGQLLDASPISIATRGSSQLPHVAYDGQNWLVAWWDTRAWEGRSPNVSPPYDIYGTRVSPAGQLLDPSGVGIATGVGDETDVSLAGGLGKWLVTYDHSSGPVAGVRARLVQSEGGGAGMGGAGGAAGGAGGGGAAGSGGTTAGAGGAAAGSGGASGGRGGDAGNSGAAGQDDGGAAGTSGGEGGDGGAGTAGEGAAGGAAGEGGEAGSSSGGRGGNGNGGGGASGGAGAGRGGSTEPPGDDGDCSCRTPGSRSASHSAWIVCLLAFGVTLSRRRSGSR